MKMKNRIIAISISIIGVLLSALVVAQVINFPSTFSMRLNRLPIQQSNDQLIFGCPYDEAIEFRVTNVYSFNITTRNVTADIQYWTKNRKCAGSKRVNLIIPTAISQQQLITNFETSVNNIFSAEANANRRPKNDTIISRGT